MNWRYGAFVLFALVIASSLVLGATLTTTVKYVVPNDLSFTITYPASTTEMWFEPTTQTDEKNATNQTSTTPIIIYTNTGNVAEFFNINLDSNPPATIVHKCAPINAGWQATCDCEGATGSPMSATRCCNVTTGSSRVNASSLAIGGTQTMWCWAKFVSSPAGTTTRTLTSTSGAT